MALTYNNLGFVDPPAVTLGEAGQKSDLRMVVADITVGTAADYVGSNGGIVPVGTNIGLNTVLFAHATQRGSTGAVVIDQVLVWDANLSGLRGLEIVASTSTALVEITSADFSDGDILRVVAIGR